MPLNDCLVRNFHSIVDARGRLGVIECAAHVPFAVQRVFFIADVIPGGTRGGHAHRELHQYLICQTGSLNVDLDDGHQQLTVQLNPGQGVYIPPVIWAVERNFSAGTVYLVLASHPYDEADYFRHRDDFLTAVGKK